MQGVRDHIPFHPQGAAYDTTSGAVLQARTDGLNPDRVAFAFLQAFRRGPVYIPALPHEHAWLTRSYSGYLSRKGEGGVKDVFSALWP
jgi:hypothetical protein